MPLLFDATYDQVNPLHRERFESGRAYIERNYEVSDEMRGVVLEHLRVHSEDSVVLFIHLLMSASPSREWWVPVPAKLMRQEVPAAYGEIIDLRERGLLEVEDDYGPRRSKQYRVVKELRQAFFDAGRELVADRLAKLAQGEGLRDGGAVRTSKTYDSNRNLYGDPMRSAIKVLKKGRFNAASLLDHFRVRWNELDEARETALLDTDGTKGLVAKADWLEKRLQNDTSCISAVFRQRPEPLEGGWSEYTLAYEPTITGRLSQVGGGLQGATREAKEAAYSGDPEVRNYDVRSSQAVILREILAEFGFKTPWLERYLEVDKGEYAERVGIDVDTWKTCLYAVLYGAVLSKPRNFHKSRGEIREALHEYAASVVAENPSIGSVDEVSRERFDALRREIGPFYKTVGKWRSKLVDEWLPEQWISSGAGKTIRNRAGALLRKTLFDSWSQRDRETRLAAFIIQGREAAFVHHLTARLPGGVTPISNEHDGLVVIGEITEKEISVAQSAAETPYLELVKKDIA